MMTAAQIDAMQIPELEWSKPTKTTSGCAVHVSKCGRYTITRMASGTYRLEAAVPLFVPKWMRSNWGLLEAKDNAQLCNNPNWSPKES
jgi:hypothetical protein